MILASLLAAAATLAPASAAPAVRAAASSLSFGGFVPPHRARDGVRYRVEAAPGVDLPDAMKQCLIEDYAPIPAEGNGAAYQFAVTRAAEQRANCLRDRLAEDVRLEKTDNWIADAQAD